jgi:hypothetical protein
MTSAELRPQGSVNQRKLGSSPKVAEVKIQAR